MGSNNIIFIGGIIKGLGIDLVSKSIGFPQYAANKFQLSLIKGFEENDLKFEFVNLPFIGSFPGLHKKIWISRSNVNFSNFSVVSLGFCNITKVKYFSRFLSLLLYGILKLRRGDMKIIVYSVHLPFIFAVSILKMINPKIKVVLIVLDLPGLMRPKNNCALVQAFFDKIYSYIYNSYCDGFILLTKYMPPKMNIESKPFLVIEGIVDSSGCIQINSNPHNFGIYILYAGGIDLKYGIIELIESFQNIERKDIKLILCGGGDFANTLKIICSELNNIHFLGIKSPEEISELQKSALLIVNPRLNNQEFVKYSFPSKVIESMYSGTPLVHHMLPGIPEEYYEFSFVFSGDKVSDMTDTFNSLLSLSTSKLNEMGKSAKQFVIRKKSAKMQTKKILNFISKL